MQACIAAIGSMVGVPLDHMVRVMAVFLAGSWIALLFHELGHAFAALALGVRIWGVRLGVGPVVWRGTVGQCRVHLAMLPFLGAVHLLDEDACAIGYRDMVAGRWRFEWGPQAWRAPIISAAGGLSNLVGVLLLGAWWNWMGQPAPRHLAGRSPGGRHGVQLRRVPESVALLPVGRDPSARPHQRGRSVPPGVGRHHLAPLSAKQAWCLCLPQISPE